MSERHMTAATKQRGWCQIPTAWCIPVGSVLLRLKLKENYHTEVGFLKSWAQETNSKTTCSRQKTNKEASSQAEQQQKRIILRR